MNNWSLEELQNVVEEFTKYEESRPLEVLLSDTNTVRPYDSYRAEKIKSIYVRFGYKRNREEAVHTWAKN